MNTEPAQTIGAVEMVSVTWLLNNLTSSVDGYDGVDMETYMSYVDWSSLIHFKSGDSQFGALLATIMRRGFRVPIVVDTAYHEDSLALGNGHHRIAAAILLGLDEIPVYWASGDYMSEHYSDTENILDESEYRDYFDITF